MIMSRDFEVLMDEWRDTQVRDARIVSEAKLMWLVIGAIHNVIADDGRCVIEADGATADVLREIVGRVERQA